MSDLEPEPRQPVPPQPLATLSLSEIEGVENALEPKPDGEAESETEFETNLEDVTKKKLTMQLTHSSSRDPMLLLPELKNRMELLFAAYLAKYPDAPQPKISQTTRSASDQSLDYAKGRTAPGSIITNAKPGQSLHNYQPGLAFDVFFEENGKYSTDETLYRNLGTLAPSVGLEWGGVWKHPDTPHFQPMGYTWELASKGVEPTFPAIVPTPETNAVAGTEEAPKEVQGENA